MKTGVLMVTGAYWPELSGGGLQARTMIQALSDTFRFQVWTTCTDETLPAESIVEGIPVTRAFVDVTSGMSKLRAALGAIRFFWTHHSSFHIVHLHGVSQKSTVMALLARLFGKKIVITIHTAGQDEPEAVKRFGALAYWCYSSADRFVAISEGVAAAMRDAGFGDRLRVIPNGVDTSRFQPPDDDQRRAAKRAIGVLPQDVPWILFVGFFSKDKRPDVLFDAWLQLQQQHPRSSALLFVGATESKYHEVDSGLASQIRKRAEAAGLADFVHFAGEMPDVERAYRAADVFVMPSTREAFGMVLIEAMASGLPVVATRIPSVTDEIVGDSGVLVPPSDAAAVAAALSTLLNDPRSRGDLGARARQRVSERYGMTVSAQRWASLYQEVRA